MQMRSHSIEDLQIEDLEQSVSQKFTTSLEPNHVSFPLLGTMSVKNGFGILEATQTIRKSLPLDRGGGSIPK